MTLKILQGNIDRGREAMDLIYQIAGEEKADIIIMAEPNRIKVTQSNWLVDNRIDIAIRINNKNIQITQTGRGDGFVWIETHKLVIYGCYISPNVGLAQFSGFLRALRGEMKKHSKESIVGGDFNAKSYLWGSPIEDKRGQILAEWLAEEDLIVLNQGNAPTFRRREYQSYIDVTFCTQKIAKQVINWKVLEEESLSFHQHIVFEMAENVDTRRRRNTPINRGWITKRDRLDNLIKEAGKIMETTGSPKNPNELADVIIASCNRTLPKKGCTNRKPVYWWCNEVAEKRNICLRRRRDMCRANKRGNADDKVTCQVLYRESRANLKIEIIEAKKRAWKKVLDEVDDDIWGKGYQIVMKRLKGTSSADLDDGKQQEIARTLFPTHAMVRWARIPVNVDEIPLFTAKELKNAGAKIKVKRAAGPDGIPPEVVKVIVANYPTECLKVLNNCLKNGEFPLPWKRAKLVLIEKQKPDQQTKAYRPICVLNVLGKLMEQMILGRLQTEITRNGDLNEQQFGFRAGRSTIDAIKKVQQIADEAKGEPRSLKKFCALITLDVQNAFNTAPWGGGDTRRTEWQRLCALHIQHDSQLPRRPNAECRSRKRTGSLMWSATRLCARSHLVEPILRRRVKGTNTRRSYRCGLC